MEVEVIQWYREHEELYNSKLKLHKDTAHKEQLYADKAAELGLESKCPHEISYFKRITVSINLHVKSGNFSIRMKLHLLPNFIL